MDCAPHHKEPAMTATLCQRCGERINDPIIALCLDCLGEELDAEARVPKIDAAIAALDLAGEEEL